MEHQINNQIKSQEVFVIGENGEQIGIKSITVAQQMADDLSLDLVNVSPTASPPVCKILDYGKFKYEQNRKQKEVKKNQKTIETKEMRLSVRIEEHDYQTKIRNVRKFLEAGNKVRISVQFRGREIVHPEIGKNLLTRFATEVADISNCEKTPKLEGQQMLIILTPKS